MDKPPQNDLTDSSLHQQSSEILTCDVSRSSSDHDAEKEACAPKNEEPVVAETPHQSGSSQSSCGITPEPCQSTEEVKGPDFCDQPVPDSHLSILQSSSSENSQQPQTPVDVSPLEGVVIQKLASHMSLENPHNTGLPNGSVQVLRVNCCEGMSPDQDSNGNLCATIETDSSNTTEVHESCPLVESPGSVDDRERFSEHSDLSQEIYVESNSSGEGTLLLCDKGDQTCTSSTSVDSGIQSKLTDVESSVKQLIESSHLCSLGDGTSCCVTNNLCKHSQFKTLAASVVDNVLEVAAKRLLELQTRDKIVEIRQSSLTSDNIHEQMTVGRDDVTGGEGDTTKLVSSVEEGLNEKYILNIVSEQSTSPMSSSDDVSGYIQLTDEKSNSQVQSCVEGSERVIGDLSVVSSSHSTYLNDFSASPNLPSSECVSNKSECDSSVIVEQTVKENDVRFEAKQISSNDDLHNREDFDNNVKKAPSPIKETRCHNLGEKPEISCGVSGNYKGEVSSAEENVKCESEVQSSKQVVKEADDKSFPVANGACVIDGSLDEANSQNCIAASTVSPVLCTSLDGRKNLKSNQEPSLEVAMELNDLSHVDDNSVLKSAEPNINLQYCNAVDNVSCSSVSGAIGCEAELNVAIINENALNHSSFQENTEKTELICAEQVSAIQEMNTVSDEKSSVLTSVDAENKLSTREEENFAEMVIPSTETDPVLPEETKDKFSEKMLSSTMTAPIPPQGEMKENFICSREETLVEEAVPFAESAPVISQEETEDKSVNSKEDSSGKGVVSSTKSTSVSPREELEGKSNYCTEEKLLEELIPSSDTAPVSAKAEKSLIRGQEENLAEEEIPSPKCTPVLLQEEVEEELVENAIPSALSLPESPKEEEGKKSILEEEEGSMEIATTSPQEETPNEELEVEEERFGAEITPSSDLSASESSAADNVEYSKLAIEEPKSEEVGLKDDISASIPLLGSAEDFADEERNSTVPLCGSTKVPLTKLEQIEVSMSNHSGENGHTALSTVPCQLIVPVVNVCPPILEETFDGITDDESEISHATSDSESDSNVKMVKPVCDGVNTINYKPLLEEDSNDRSTLSLISEWDEASVREDNLEPLEDESVSLIVDESVDNVEKDNAELVQRVKGQRIRHDTKEELSAKGVKPLEGSPSAEFAAKIKDIKDALKSGSLERLRDLAKSEGGLVNDELRREAWPRLLGIESSSSSIPLPPISVENLRKHHEYNQVVLDVNRSLRRFPSKISPEERVELQNQLTEIILRVLMKRKDLSYYQGYHDVAVTTLLVAGKDAAFHILEHISIAHLSDCMLPTMERTMYLLNYIYPLIQRINPLLSERMDRLEIGTIFCLPWYLTWYGYSLKRYNDVVRIFDYFLASPPLTPLYLAAVVVGRRSAEVLSADSDHATVHALLSRIPETLPFEDLLREATDLYRNYPPDDIEKEVHERCERLQKAQEEEEEQRRRMRQRRMIQRRHSMPTIAARQMPGWFMLDRFLGLPMIQGRRFIQVSATLMFGVIAWHLRGEMYRYF